MLALRQAGSAQDLPPPQLHKIHHRCSIGPEGPLCAPGTMLPEPVAQRKSYLKEGHAYPEFLNYHAACQFHAVNRPKENMTTGRFSSKSGEHLLAVLPFPEPQAFRPRIREAFPNLKVTYIHQPFGVTHWDTAEFDKSLYQDATILTTLSAIPTPEEAPNLRLIQLLPAGVDHLLDHPIFKSPNVEIATTSGIHAPQIAEWVIMNILTFAHHGRHLANTQSEGRWVSHSELQESQGPVKDMTVSRVGILGYGSIGRQIARVCHNMGSTILAFTASPRTTTESRYDDGFCIPGTGDPEGSLPSQWFHGLDKASVHEFLQQNLDVLVVCLPLTAQSEHMIGAEELALLGQYAIENHTPGTLLVNVSRGRIVDQEALVNSLKKPIAEGGLRGAALDVTDPEPLPQMHELWRLGRAIVHPHVSGLTTEHVPRYIGVLEENLKRWDNGDPLVNVVKKSRGY